MLLLVTRASLIPLPASSAASGAVGTLHVYLAHRSALPEQLQLPDTDPAALLTDRVGACFGTANLATCLLLLALAPTLGWDMWVITLAGALLHGAYNLVALVARDPHSGHWLPPAG